MFTLAAEVYSYKFPLCIFFLTSPCVFLHMHFNGGALVDLSYTKVR